MGDDRFLVLSRLGVKSSLSQYATLEFGTFRRFLSGREEFNQREPKKPDPNTFIDNDLGRKPGLRELTCIGTSWTL